MAFISAHRAGRRLPPRFTRMSVEGWFIADVVANYLGIARTFLHCMATHCNMCMWSPASATVV